jgi:hypothetical protein
MGINVGAESEKSISCCQFGVKNKMIFQIEDQRQLKELQIETSGAGKIIFFLKLTTA